MFYIVMLLFFPDGSSSRIDHLQQARFGTYAQCVLYARQQARVIAPIIAHGSFVCQSKGETPEDIRRYGEVSFGPNSRW